MRALLDEIEFHNKNARKNTNGTFYVNSYWVTETSLTAKERRMAEKMETNLFQ